jgi:hypothetical protein
MSLVRLVIDSNGTADDFKSQCNLAMGGLDAANNFVDYVAGLTGGNMMGADLAFKVGAVQATATLTVSSTGSANDETCSICNVTFTAKTSGATGNQFNISSTPATQAANMVAAFNASADLAGKVVASRVDAVVTLTAVVPGLLGNGLQISEGLTNVALSAFANGSDGTAYNINLGG